MGTTVSSIQTRRVWYYLFDFFRYNHLKLVYIIIGND